MPCSRCRIGRCLQRHTGFGGPSEIEQRLALVDEHIGGQQGAGLGRLPLRQDVVEDRQRTRRRTGDQQRAALPVAQCCAHGRGITPDRARHRQGLCVAAQRRCGVAL